MCHESIIVINASSLVVTWYLVYFTCNLPSVSRRLREPQLVVIRTTMCLYNIKSEARHPARRPLWARGVIQLVFGLPIGLSCNILSFQKLMWSWASDSLIIQYDILNS
ncbi:hypothetical protein AFLA_004650 [Aspergillus flavus NRRL3357]|nr:hypothetical protein AFLA_004650 [Aspergillus flavus NRRL3357]